MGKLHTPVPLHITYQDHVNNRKFPVTHGQHITRLCSGDSVIACKYISRQENMYVCSIVSYVLQNNIPD